MHIHRLDSFPLCTCGCVHMIFGPPVKYMFLDVLVGLFQKDTEKALWNIDVS